VPSAAHALHDLEQMVTGSGREMEDAANFERYSKEFNPMTGTGLIEVWMPVNDRTKET
jgi:predicted transcriptional regulator YdeE